LRGEAVEGSAGVAGVVTPRRVRGGAPANSQEQATLCVSDKRRSLFDERLSLLKGWLTGSPIEQASLVGFTGLKKARRTVQHACAPRIFHFHAVIEALGV
jgi:hypothetical protein